jgi:uncharacterized membrane protein
MFQKLKNIFRENQREPFPDFLRGLAIVLMIQVHITELLLETSPTNLLIEKWSYFFGGIPAAPIFLILMGYYQDKSKSNLKKELIRGLKIFVLGLILNLLMNLSLIYRFMNGNIDVNIYSYIFGVDILIFAGLSYSIMALLRRVIKNLLPLASIILIVYILDLFLRDININSNNLRYLFSFFHRKSA